MATTKETAAKIVAETKGAYSADRYRSWHAVAVALLNAGYSEAQARTIMESKITRWAADESNAAYGRVPATAVIRFIIKYPDIACDLCGSPECAWAWRQ